MNGKSQITLVKDDSSVWTMDELLHSLSQEPELYLSSSEALINDMLMGLNGHRYAEPTLKDGIAYVPIDGAFASPGSYWGYSYTSLMRHLQYFEKLNPDLVCLDMRTPGGVGVGMYEAAEFLYEYARRRKVAVFVSDYIASSGQLLAAAATAKSGLLLVSHNAKLGSVDCLMGRTDVSEMNKKSGISRHFFSLGKKKQWGQPDVPMTDEERKYMQEQAESGALTFMAKVSEYGRGSVDFWKQMEGGTVSVGSPQAKGLFDHIVERPDLHKFLMSKRSMSMKTGTDAGGNKAFTEMRMESASTDQPAATPSNVSFFSAEEGAQLAREHKAMKEQLARYETAEQERFEANLSGAIGTAKKAGLISDGDVEYFSGLCRQLGSTDPLTRLKVPKVEYKQPTVGGGSGRGLDGQAEQQKQFSAPLSPEEQAKLTFEDKIAYACEWPATIVA